jgi:cyanophycinase-like exopeptidase
LYYPPTFIDQFIIITVESQFKKDFGCLEKNRVFKQSAVPTLALLAGEWRRMAMPGYSIF